MYGNDKPIEQLVKNYNAKDLPQSIIFEGPKGIGKSSLASKFATQLMSNKESIQSCDLRANINSEENSHNIYVCKREFDESSKKYKTVISIEQIRKLKEFFSLSQTEDNWRIAIIDAADEMNEASTNAILKILEEPPDKSIIILISHNYHSLKPTIISRCQKISLKALNQLEMHEFLNKQIDNSDEKELISSISEGIPAIALSLLNLGALNTYKALVGLLSHLPEPIEAKISELIGSQNYQKLDGSTLDLNDLILILIHRLIGSILKGKEVVSNNIERKLFEKIFHQRQTAISLAELYLDLEQTLKRAQKINIEKADISLNFLTKIAKVFTDRICL